MSTWAPSAEGLQQLLGLFRASGSADNTQHRRIQQQLVDFNVIPDYNSYLAYIFNQLKSEDGAVRQMAGLVLKNNVKEHWGELSSEVQEYVRENLLGSLGDPQPYIRNVSGSCVTTVIYAGGLEAWPMLVPTLYQMLDSPDTNTLEGALSALSKICEDSPEKLANDANHQPLHFLIPKFLQFFGHAHPGFRCFGVTCINHFVMLMPAALRSHIDQYIQGLFALATDPNPDTRRGVCQALVMLLDTAIDKLVPHLPAIVQYMLQATLDADETVALEACEFWSSICETKVVHDALTPVLPQLIPVLLKGMVYSELDIVFLEEQDEADEQQPDRPEDVKPRFHKARVERLASPQWEVRESGILALGAIAEGCVDAIAVYLPQLVPWLVTTLSDPKALVRSITCWTLSRYSKWVVQQPDHSLYLQPMMQELLKRVLDHNKKVQEAACSAFATLEEDAEAILVPYLGPILQNLIFAFAKYQAKNLLILYDAIGTLADSVGSALNTPEHVGVLMPPLIEKWNAVRDDDKSLLPLLECFTSISQALGPGFAPFARPVYTRCVTLIEGTLRAEQQATFSGDDPPDKEFVVCALDLISGLTEGLGVGIQPLVVESSPTLQTALLACMSDALPDVRQSAYALVGDLAKACIDPLRPVLGQYLPLLSKQLNPDFVSVCNNASWAIGEIAIKVGAEMRDFVEPILRELIPILLKHDELNRSLLENTAITIGRLALVAPEVGAPLLDSFIAQWSICLRSIRDDIEKQHAFQGLARMVALNPRAPLHCMQHLCDAFASWGHPPPELNEQMQQILQGYKTSLPQDQWGQFMQSLPQDLRNRLIERYQL